MAKIRMDIESLKSNSSKLSSKISELEGLNNRLESLIARIESSWDGQASETYCIKMREHLAKAKDLIKVLTAYKEYVDNAVEKFKSLDHSAGNGIKGAF